MPAIKNELKQVYYEWKRTSNHVPATKAEFAKQNGLARDTLYRWDVVEPKPEDFDLKEYLKSRGPEAIDGLFKSVKAGSPAALKIYYQLIDELVEKSAQEHTFKLDASYLTRLENEARRERDSGIRVEVEGEDKLQGEPTLLPVQIRSHSDEVKTSTDS